jgi:hypothetical protein
LKWGIRKTLQCRNLTDSDPYLELPAPGAPVALTTRKLADQQNGAQRQPKQVPDWFISRPHRRRRRQNDPVAAKPCTMFLYHNPRDPAPKIASK